MSRTEVNDEAIAIPRSAVRRTLWTILTVVALILVALVAWGAFQALRPSDPLAEGINANDYQAVFLTNGQVYFGKMTAPGGDFYYLRHVYYLTNPPGGKGGRTLAKLTNDVHGPEDLVIVNRNEILYVENLNPKGRAAQLINKGGSSP